MLLDVRLCLSSRSAFLYSYWQTACQNMQIADSEYNAIFSTPLICKETLQLSVKGFDKISLVIV